MKMCVNAVTVLILSAFLAGCAAGVPKHLLDKSELQLTGYLAVSRETKAEQLKKIKKSNQETVTLGNTLAKSIKDAANAQQGPEYKSRQDQIFWGYVGTGIGTLATTLGTIVTSKDGKIIVGVSTATLTAATLIYTKLLENKQGELAKFIEECEKTDQEWRTNRRNIEDSETDLKQAQEKWKNTNGAYKSLSESAIAIKKKYSPEWTNSIMVPPAAPELK